MHFESLDALAVHLAHQAVAMPLALEAGLDAVAKRIEATAKGEIGHYQPAVSGFPAWAELADATKADRLAKGFSENDPELRTGAFRDAIQREVSLAALAAVIGVPASSPVADVAAYQEFGTSKMPARPVLGPAAVRNKSAIERLVGAALVSGLIGQQQVHQALGYDFQAG